MSQYEIKAMWQEFSITAEELAEAELAGALERAFQARIPLYLSLGLDLRKCRAEMVWLEQRAREAGSIFLKLQRESWLAEAREKERGWLRSERTEPEVEIEIRGPYFGPAWIARRILSEEEMEGVRPEQVGACKGQSPLEALAGLLGAIAEDQCSFCGSLRQEGPLCAACSESWE